MRNCFSRFLLPGMVSLVALLAAASCTQVDNTLGSGLIPGGQQMEMRIDTLGLDAAEAVKAYLSFTDTVNSHNQTIAIMGKYRSGTYGKTAAATLMQFLPMRDRVDTTDMGFGYGAVVDSVKLLMAMNHMWGEKTVEQTFNIFRLKDTLRTDTAYYVNFPYEDYIDEEPVFTFDYSGESANAAVENIKTEITPAGEEFLRELISDTSIYGTTRNSAPAFRKKFPGLLMAPAAGSPDEGSLYYTTLPYTFLEIYLHNYTDPSLATIKDSGVRQTYYLDDEILFDTIPRNHSVISVRHDYAGTPMDGVQEGPLETRTGYVQGMAGVTTTLEFPDAFFDAIDALKEEPSDGIMIHQAMIYVYVESDQPGAMDASHPRLGSYIQYSTLAPIPDYMYTQESASPETTLAYGGTLNRTYGYYALNITNYLHIARINKSVPRRFTLAPQAYPYIPNDAFSWKETALTIPDAGEGDERQVKVKLTYTLIK